MNRITDHNRKCRTGLAGLASLLLATASISTVSAQDEILTDLQIVGASFNNPVEPGGLVTVEVTVSNSGTTMAPGTGTSESSYMIDFVLSTDSHVPADFAVYNDAFEEDVLLLGGRISNTNDLMPGAAEFYLESSWLPSDTPPGEYQLCLVIDPGDEVAESDETNNSYCRPLTVVESALRDVPTAVAEIEGATVPGSFSLDQNYPNPFNPSTNIRFSVPRAAAVVVRVFDALGQEQATLVDEVLRAGSYTVDYHADGLASGLYFYRIEAPGYRQTRKFTLLK